jgi:GNAT superfamily N-acetyltransferase
MECRRPGTFKIWRPIEPRLAEPPLDAPLDVDVRRLGAADTDAVAELNLLAWGAWNNPAMHAWFGATVGRAGWQHYGVFDADRLVATGALRTSDGLGWFGFDATHPRHQGKQLRQAISARRLADAAAQGCTIVHAESAIAPGPRVFRDGWQSLYEKQNYSTVTGVGNDEIDD